MSPIFSSGYHAASHRRLLDTVQRIRSSMTVNPHDTALLITQARTTTTLYLGRSRYHSSPVVDEQELFDAMLVIMRPGQSAQNLRTYLAQVLDALSDDNQPRILLSNVKRRARLLDAMGAIHRALPTVKILTTYFTTDTQEYKVLTAAHPALSSLIVNELHSLERSEITQSLRWLAEREQLRIEHEAQRAQAEEQRRWAQTREALLDAYLIAHPDEADHPDQPESDTQP